MNYVEEWERVMKKFLSLSILLLCALGLTVPAPVEASQSTVSTQPLSPGVTWNKYDFRSANKHEINHIAVDLNNPHATVDIGLPTTFGAKMRTTALATKNSNGNGHRVVGAINAAFYHMDNGMPIYLVAKDNNIYNSGIISTGNDAFVSNPIAFGITSNGNAEIDNFSTQFKATLPTKTMIVDGVNRLRETNELIVYTPQHHSSSTLTNQFGVEYIFQSDGPVASTKFGQTLKGKVVAIHPYGSTGKREIPKNGFALSATKDKATALQSLEMGEEVTVRLGIDSKWQNAKFVMASGPMLVKDGKRHLTMDPNSWRARQVAARSAIAISRDKKQAHFITVDATSTSKGMTLTQFANYIASLGYDRALNLDGGGSTTMGYRPYGTHQIKLANRPSAGSERAVSAILEAVSSAPLGQAKHINYTTNKSTLSVGETGSISVNYVTDAAYNPLAVANVYLEAKGDVVTVNGQKFTAKKAGTGEVNVKYGDIVLGTFKVKVAEAVSYNFIDIPANFIYAKELDYLFKNEIITGYKDNTFRPQDTLSRDHAMVILARYLKLDTTSVTDPGFTDVPKTHYYYKEIAAVANAGIVSGKDGGKIFAPSDTITRAQLSKILVEAFNLKGNANKPFTDVGPTNWAYDYVQAMVANNVSTGYTDGTFKPNQPIQRIHFGKFLYNLAQ